MEISYFLTLVPNGLFTANRVVYGVLHTADRNVPETAMYHLLVTCKAVPSVRSKGLQITPSSGASNVNMYISENCRKLLFLDNF